MLLCCSVCSVSDEELRCYAIAAGVLEFELKQLQEYELLASDAGTRAGAAWDGDVLLHSSQDALSLLASLLSGPSEAPLIAQVCACRTCL